MNREQELINLTFQLVLTIKDSRTLIQMSNEQVASWITEKLLEYEFDVVTSGPDWGNLRDHFESDL